MTHCQDWENSSYSSTVVSVHGDKLTDGMGCSIDSASLNVKSSETSSYLTHEAENTVFSSSEFVEALIRLGVKLK